MARGGKTKFQPGQSGNPRGRPPGRPDRRNLFHWVSEDDRKAVFAKCVALAKDGDPAAMRLVLDRIAPTRKPSHEPVNLPAGFAAMTPIEQVDSINAEVAAGRIPPDIGTVLVGLVEAKMRALEHDAMEQRIKALEDLVAAIEDGARNG
jgi:hypothetical protein